MRTSRTPRQAAVAFELEGALGRAMFGWLAGQVERIAREPGVREQR